MTLKEILRFCFVLLLSLGSFVACDKDDENDPDSVLHPWLEGKINDQKVCIDQDATYNGVMSLNQMSDFLWWIQFSREITDTDYVLQFCLGELQESASSDHRISNGKYEELKESCSLIKEKEGEDIHYYPSRIPCDIQIHSFERKALTGSIEGIFYNMDNSSDSIVLSAQFRIRLDL